MTVANYTIIYYNVQWLLLGGSLIFHVKLHGISGVGSNSAFWEMTVIAADTLRPFTLLTPSAITNGMSVSLNIRHIEWGFKQNLQPLTF